MEERLRALEIQVTSLRGDLTAHEKFCDARWRVMWKLVAFVSSGIALAVALAVELLWRPS
jgi:hypothetical protein